jgi:anti-anti-sigma factor
VQLKLVSDDGVVIRVACEGPINLLRQPSEEDPLASLLGQTGYQRKVLLDLERATYINSPGISWLVVSHKHFRRDGGELFIHSVPPMIDEVIQLMKLPTIMSFAPDEASARALALGEKS